jgi:hypothetical protein
MSDSQLITRSQFRHFSIKPGEDTGHCELLEGQKNDNCIGGLVKLTENHEVVWVFNSGFPRSCDSCEVSLRPTKEKK